MLPADSPFAPLPAPGPHPAPAELRAYAAGTLPPAEEHRLETHTLDCERCADILAGFSMSDAATTDHAVAELRTRLQARVNPARPEPVAGSWAWPRLAAAAALVAAVGGGIWSWQQQPGPPAPATARLETTAPAATGAAPAATADAASSASIAMAPRPPAAAAAADMPPPPPPPLVAMQTDKYVARMRAPLANRVQADAMPPAASPAADADYPAEPAAAAETTDGATYNASAKAVMADRPAAAAPAPTVAAQGAAGNGTAAFMPTAADSLINSESAKTSRQFAKAKATISGRAAENTARVTNVPLAAAPSIGPAPVGGTIAFKEYLRRGTLEFMPENGSSSLSGLVRLRFTVGADGKVRDLKVVRGLRADYDAEALRLVCEGPAWQPGVAGGRRAPLPMEITVAF